MPADLGLTFVRLLHQGGWDEVIMVGIGLLVAYIVIMWTGRRSRDDDEADDSDEDEDEDTAEAAGPRH